MAAVPSLPRARAFSYFWTPFHFHHYLGAWNRLIWTLFKWLLPENTGVYCYQELEMVLTNPSSMCTPATSFGWEMSLKWMQGNENVQHNSAAYYSESNSDIYNQSLVSQRKNLSNKDLTTYVAVNNQWQQNGNGFMTPSHVYAKCSPPAKCHRPNCPSYLCTQEMKQINSSCNKKRPEKGDIPKSSLLVNIPSPFQKTHVVQDEQNDVGSGLNNWLTVKELL